MTVNVLLLFRPVLPPSQCPPPWAAVEGRPGVSGELRPGLHLAWLMWLGGARNDKGHSSMSHSGLLTLLYSSPHNHGWNVGLFPFPTEEN